MQAMQDIAQALAELKTRGRLRARRVVEASEGMRIHVDGRWLLSFASNDYLGLAADSSLSAPLADLPLRTRLGAAASHLLSGHHAEHAELEAALTAVVGLPTLLFGSGYMANLAVVASLIGRDGEVYADKLNHASLVDATTLSRARHRRYRHNDLTHLDALLASSTARAKLIVSDAVFSMDGDVADLSGLLELAQRHQAWLYIDDAHGFGVLGARGAGSLAAQSLSECFAAYPMALYMATLGKAIGVAGAFVAADARVIEWLVNKARTYIYTTAMPPIVAALARANLSRALAEDWRRERLARHIQRFRECLADTPWRLMPSITPIQPIVVGDDARAIRLTETLSAAGCYVPAIRPPTVPEGTARLRVSLSAGHTSDEVGHLIELLRAHAGE